MAGQIVMENLPWSSKAQALVNHGNMVAEACRNVGLAKHATCHAFRHSFRHRVREWRARWIIRKAESDACYAETI